MSVHLWFRLLPLSQLAYLCAVANGLEADAHDIAAELKGDLPPLPIHISGFGSPDKALQVPQPLAPASWPAAAGFKWPRVEGRAGFDFSVDAAAEDEKAARSAAEEEAAR
jgi:hypothetical protein